MSRKLTVEEMIVNMPTGILIMSEAFSLAVWQGACREIAYLKTSKKK